ncbi:hypothetical protein IJG20_02270 [Candidatus Saccharibacteria bacterium]|nr:hypothetical protein [Candidatus Saccharibacteria bacterium]
MIIVRIVEVLIAALVSVLGVGIYHSAIRQIALDYESRHSDLRPPEDGGVYGLIIGLLSFAVISYLLLRFIGGPVISVIFLILGGMLSILFLLLLIINSGRRSWAAFGCLLPPLSIVYYSTVELAKPNNIAAFSVITLVFCGLALTFFVIAKIKEGNNLPNSQLRKTPQRRDENED